MTAKLILDAALAHFARDGYEGTSLRAIAEDVGIKKPSIYAHFTGKEDLFLRVVEKVFDDERKAMNAYFLDDANRPIEEVLRGFLERQLTEFERNNTWKFMLRVSYFPPQVLYNEVMGIVDPYLEDMEEMLLRYFDQLTPSAKRSIIDPETISGAYWIILTGLQIELLYSSSVKVQQRLEASWLVFWKGIIT